MSKELVVIKKNDLVTTSLQIAEGMEKQHRAIMELVNKYSDLFEKKGRGTFAVLTAESTGGRPLTYAYLNEENSIFLISLMRNNERVVRFKDKLSAAFISQRQTLNDIFSKQQNNEWLDRRKSGKILRKEETDIIKQFVEYAIKSGSKKAETYYYNITKMENKALFFISQKYPNLRDIMDTQQLFFIGTADQIIVKSLKEGMEKNLFYKDIYKLARKNVESFAKIIGKTPLPKVIEYKKKDAIDV